MRTRSTNCLAIAACVASTLAAAVPAHAQSADVRIGEPVGSPAPSPGPPVVVNPAIPPYPPLVIDARGRPHIRRAIPYPGGPLPPGTSLDRRARIPFVAAGAGALVAGYAFAVAQWASTLSCSSVGGGPFVCTRPSAWLFVPVVGPWLALADYTPYGLDVGWVVVSGVLQGLGVAALATGFVWRRTLVVYDPGLMPGVAAQPTWSLLPWAGPGAAGVAAVGVF